MEDENIPPNDDYGDECPLPWLKRPRTLSPPVAMSDSSLSPLSEQGQNRDPALPINSPQSQKQNLLIQTIRYWDWIIAY